MIIVGITGTLGAGKGTVVEYLVKEKGFIHYSVRDFLRKELERRNMPLNRDTLTDVANNLREKHGPAHIAEALYREAERTDRNCIIESIRTPGEVKALRTKERFYLLAIDADLEIRSRRIRDRRSETDQISYDTFLMNEKREMHATGPFKQNLSGCIELADYVINNNGSIRELQRKTENFLVKIGYD